MLPAWRMIASAAFWMMSISRLLHGSFSEGPGVRPHGAIALAPHTYFDGCWKSEAIEVV